MLMLVKTALVQQMPAVAIRKTLADELAEREIAALDAEKVKRFQKEVVRLRRKDAGIWGTLWVIPRFGIPACFLAAAILLVAAVATTADLWFVGFVGTAALFSAAGVNLWITKGNGGLGVMQGSVARWRTVWLRTERNVANFVPAYLSPRCLTAQEVPGVRLGMEQFEYDPFLFAQRGWGPWRERCYIGHWGSWYEEFTE